MSHPIGGIDHKTLIAREISGSNYVATHSRERIRSRNGISRAFADNADDILLRARTSAPVQSA